MPKVVLSRMEVTATQTLDWDQCWDFLPQDIHPIGVEDWVLGLKGCETLTHSQLQPQGPRTHKKEVNNQTDNQNRFSVPPKGPFFTTSFQSISHGINFQH